MSAGALERLQAAGVSLRRGGRPVLRDVTLALAPGELVCLLGKNGAGKSTLLRVLLGLMQPDAGTVALCGRQLADWRRRDLATRLAYVPQTHQAPFPYTVRQVVAMGRLPAQGLFGAMRSTDDDAIERTVRELDITAFADRSYTEVSGGERQLALIGRALAQQARLLILDEPLSGLDYGYQQRLLGLLRTLVAGGRGVLMTTHDPDLALAAAGRVALLIDGRVVADGRPAEILDEAQVHRLYGVPVRLHRDSDGRPVAFRPADL